MKLRDFIQSQAIIAQLSAGDREGVLRELVGALVAAGSLSAEAADEIVVALVKREKTGSTGFGKGVAVPHAKHAKVPRLVAAVGLSEAGVEFAAVDRKPVHSFVLVLSPAGQDQQHLAAMQAIFRSLHDDMFRKFLRQANTREKVLELFEEADAK